MEKVFLTIEELQDKAVKWIDARFSLQDPTQGKRAYEQEHIVGAVYWDLEKDLSDMSKDEGRHPMPDHAQLTQLFRKSGLLLEDEIVVYDDGASPFATRAWWMLQYAGFKNSFISLAGFEQLKEAGFATEKVSPTPPPTMVQPLWQHAIYANKEDVKKVVAGETVQVLLDARAAERFRGELEPLDPVAGHIPGAKNYDWEQLQANGQFRLDESVRQQLDALRLSDSPITVYCGSGVSATPLFATLKHFGYPHVRLYVGSFSDWLTTEEVETDRQQS